MNKEQIVCGCFKVTIGDLVEEIEKGTKKLEELQKFIYNVPKIN